MSSIAGKALVMSNEWINDEYKHMIIQVGDDASRVEPGQFFNLYCPQVGVNKPFFRRPMSTYFADTTTQRVEFLYKVVGAGTKGLAEVSADQYIDFVGPLGRGFHLHPTDQHILVIGRGVGLATLAPLAELAAKNHVKVTAILSAKDKTRLMSQHRFLNIGADIVEVIDTDHSSDVAHVAQLIRHIHLQTRIDAFFTCGSSRLTKMLQELSNDFGVRGEVALEKNMACGIGICHGCVIATKDSQQTQLISRRVCQDGPVFDLNEVVL